MGAEGKKNWTIAEAKARLSEILRLSDKEGPQRIGTRKTYVLVPEEEWQRRVAPREPLGRWLVAHLADAGELELPDRRDPERPVPFADEAEA